MKRQLLIDLLDSEIIDFKEMVGKFNIVPDSIPILWFGNIEDYFQSDLKIITVSLNPSDIEFKSSKSSQPSTALRFPDFNGTSKSLFDSLNKYFSFNPYNAWFKASFGTVLGSFQASHDGKLKNAALHTDIGSPYATSPTWTGLSNSERTILESKGSRSWHRLVQILEPDIILFSASKNYEKKILFPQVKGWDFIDVKAQSPLLKGTFVISKEKISTVLFQVQGRKPFLKTIKEEKMKFSMHVDK